MSEFIADMGTDGTLAAFLFGLVALVVLPLLASRRER